MSLSMRECIRWLKKEMADIVEEDPPLSDDDARNRLTERIGHFIRERITMADQLIVQNGLQKIQDGDVILTFAKSSENFKSFAIIFLPPCCNFYY